MLVGWRNGKLPHDWRVQLCGQIKDRVEAILCQERARVRGAIGVTRRSRKLKERVLSKTIQPLHGTVEFQFQVRVELLSEDETPRGGVHRAASPHTAGVVFHATLQLSAWPLYLGLSDLLRIHLLAPGANVRAARKKRLLGRSATLWALNHHNCRACGWAWHRRRSGTTQLR